MKLHGFIPTVGGLDYEELNADNIDHVLLHFTGNTSRLSFQVTIIDDEMFESLEEFKLELRFDSFYPQPSGVKLQPNLSAVYILDNDSTISHCMYTEWTIIPHELLLVTDITIGFLNTSYSTSVADCQFSVQVGVLSGSLQRLLIVNFSIGKWFYR